MLIKGWCDNDWTYSRRLDLKIIGYGLAVAAAKYICNEMFTIDQ